MSDDSPAGDKAGLRPQLEQLATGRWRRVERPGQNIPDAFERADVDGPDGVRYTLLRKSEDPDGLVLIFDPDEIKAFDKGVANREFDLPG